MNENKPLDAAGSEIPDDAGLQGEASQSMREGNDLRERMHDLTLRALRHHRLDRHGVRAVMNAVTSGIAIGAADRGSDLRTALADALRGVDEALTRSAEASRQALSQLAATGRDLTDNEIRRGLADLKQLEEDFLSAASRAAEAADLRVRPELQHVVRQARETGTATGKAVAHAFADLTRQWSKASIELAIASVEAAGEVGHRFAQLASGMLSGIADALSKPPGERPKS